MTTFILLLYLIEGDTDRYSKPKGIINTAENFSKKRFLLDLVKSGVPEGQNEVYVPSSSEKAVIPIDCSSPLVR